MTRTPAGAAPWLAPERETRRDADGFGALAVAPIHGRYVTVTLQALIQLCASIFRRVSWIIYIIHEVGILHQMNADAIVTTRTPRTALNWMRKGAGAAILAQRIVQ